ncbi:hypothetical protein O9X98_05845 [Agrobacterium salinitolerans]|nr:hypothetical protein [Agrobacterium salinitolerans]
MPSKNEAEAKVRAAFSGKLPITKDNALDIFQALIDAGRVRIPSSGRNGADMPKDDRRRDNDPKPA